MVSRRPRESALDMPADAIIASVVGWLLNITLGGRAEAKHG